MSEAMQRPLPGYMGAVFLHKPTSPLFRFIKLIKPYLIEYLRMRSIELRFLQFDGFEFLNFNWLELASPFRSKKRIEPNPVASNPPTVFDLKPHGSHTFESRATVKVQLGLSAPFAPSDNSGHGLKFGFGFGNLRP